MKPKTLVLMVVAVVCGLGASYMTSRLLADKNSGRAEEKVKVLVAKKSLDMGVTFKAPDAMFVFKEFTKGQEPKNAITKMDDIKDRMLKRPLRKDDHVTIEDLVDKNGSNNLAYSLPAGMRAVGIKVTNETSAHGFTCLPMSRVDIYHTVRKQNSNDSFSQILLENVLILASDTETKRDDNGRAMPANVVTVALSTEDALKVTMAKEIGTLSLALRKFNDNASLAGTRVTAQQVLKNTGAGNSAPKDDDVESSQPTVGVATPAIPDIPVTAQAKPVFEDPNYKYIITIIEGDRQRHQNYVLDKKTHKVVNQDVIRSEPESAPQQQLTPTPLVAPQQPGNVSPANPQPAAEDDLEPPA